MTNHESSRPGERLYNRRRDIEVAVMDLNACVERIHALIPRVNAVIDQRTRSARARARPRVLYGGGTSAFAPGGRPAAEGSPPRALRPLVVAADLALAGYSREQIRAHLRAWDERSAAEALDEAFD